MEAGTKPGSENLSTPYATNRRRKASISAAFPKWQLLSQIQFAADVPIRFKSLREESAEMRRFVAMEAVAGTN